MAGGEPKASIKIGLDTKDLEAAIKKMNDDIKGSFTELSSIYNLVSGAASVAYGAITRVASAIAEVAAEAEAAAKVQRQANVLLVEQGRLHKDELSSLNALNDARERALGVSADDQLQLQTRLKLAGVHNDQLDAATRLTIGLSSVTGNDLMSSMRAVEQAYDGNFKALAKLGFEVKNFADLQQLEGDLYKNAAAEAGTYSGQLARVGEALGHVQEQLGGVIVESNGVKDSMGLAADGTFAFGDALEFLKPIATWYLDWTIKFNRYMLGIGDYQLKAKKWVAEQVVAPFTSDKQLIDYASIDDRPSMTLADYESMPQSADGPGPSLWDKAKQRLAERRAKNRKADATGLSDAAQAILAGPSFEDEKAQILAERKTAAYQRQAEALRDLGQFFDDYNRNLDLEEDALLRAARAEDSHADALDGLKESLGSNVLGQFADGLGNVFAALASGVDAGDTLKAFFGDLISMLGTMLIQLGTAAVLAGALGSAVPLFAGLAGPQAVALGGALIAGGIAMKGVGGALGGSSGGGGDASTPSVQRAAFAGQPGAGSRRPMGGDLPAGVGWNNAGGDTYVKVEFNRPVTDPRGVARELRDFLRRGDLKPGWSR